MSGGGCVGAFLMSCIIGLTVANMFVQRIISELDREAISSEYCRQGLMGLSPCDIPVDPSQSTHFSPSLWSPHVSSALFALPPLSCLVCCGHHTLTGVTWTSCRTLGMCMPLSDGGPLQELRGRMGSSIPESALHSLAGASKCSYLAEVTRK